MEITLAREEDLPQILEIYAAARDFMVRTGNPRQWAARGWPPEELIRQDISREKCRVCREENRLLGVFYYRFGEDIDPTYRQIRGDGWIWKGPYGVVHRIAAREGSGAGRFCLRWAMEQAGHLRIDTHPDNRVMRRTLESLGFSYRGIIFVAEDNDPRYAYEYGAFAMEGSKNSNSIGK